MKIEGKVAIVTGAGAEGTGRAIALALARRGASVVASDIDPLGGREAVDMVEARGGRAAFVRADVRVGDDIRVMAALAEKTFGGLDVLVNNAGNTQVKQKIAAMSSQEQASVPRLLQPSEVADAVVGLVEDDAVAGRVRVMWCEEAPYFIDPGRRE
jgi:NAD(P)-dependent dehydrogenase (short-subunit alcohol dehydrogenase family)